MEEDESDEDRDVCEREFLRVTEGSVEVRSRAPSMKKCWSHSKIMISARDHH